MCNIYLADISPIYLTLLQDVYFVNCVLVEVEGMLNSKPLGYTSSDVNNQFWTYFIKDYLPTLQSRQKWEKPSDNLQLYTAVLIMDPQLPRAQWPVGKVTGLHPSPDQCVRSADILVQDRTYTRPVARLISLPELAN